VRVLEVQTIQLYTLSSLQAFFTTLVVFPIVLRRFGFGYDSFEARQVTVVMAVRTTQQALG